MLTKMSISDIHHTIHEQSSLEYSIPTWYDSIIWSDLYIYGSLFIDLWD